MNKHKCIDCRFLMIKHPTHDQPLTGVWCDRGCFDAYEGGVELDEETDCPLFESIVYKTIAKEAK